MQPPPSLGMETNSVEGSFHWGNLLSKAINLAYLILAFSAVGDLTQCEDLVLASFMHKKDAPTRLNENASHFRDITNPVGIGYNYFIQVTACLLEGRRKNTGYEGFSAGAVDTPP